MNIGDSLFIHIIKNGNFRFKNTTNYYPQCIKLSSLKTNKKLS